MRPENDGHAPARPTKVQDATADALDATGTSTSGDAGAAAPAADLLDAARAAFAAAYVPYSGFAVGAALRADDGAIHNGCNVENASYGLSRCAEQSAVQAMVTAGSQHFSELVVFTHAEHPASPCGACRQILFEFAPDATVHLINQHGTSRLTTVADLLPDGFVLEPRDRGSATH